MRIDKYLAQTKKKYSRSSIQKLIKEGHVMVNQVVCLKPSHDVSQSDDIQVEVPPLKKLEVKAENLNLDIIYEDDFLLIVNKPAGMVTHPSVGHHSSTLVNGLMYAVKNLSGIGGVERPGIVHRLDKDTEGLIIVAKEDAAHRKLSEMIAERLVDRRYLAWVKGKMAMEPQTIETFYGRDPRHRQKMAVIHELGKKAITHITPLKATDRQTLVE